MPDPIDLLVVGTGSAALSVAYPCRAAGWTVAVADSRPYGGTCANRGCDPKKVLVGAADAVDWARRMQNQGVSSAGIKIDWAALMRFKETFTDSVPEDRERKLRAAGIECLHGVVRFIAPDAAVVEGQEIRAKHFVIATGAAPAQLGVEGGELLSTSDDFLDLEALPDTIVFVGGGYIAFEFAHLSARAGAKVIIVHRGPRPLEAFDADVAEQLARHTRKIGIDLRVNAPVTRVERTASGFAIEAGGQRIEAAAVFHAAGRTPNIEALDLEKAGVAQSPKGVDVNEYLQSPTNPRVYAAGDAAASGPPLTPVAGYHGRLICGNLLNGNRERVDYTGVPSAVFTTPPLAAVGLTEEAARKQGLDFDVHKQDTTGWYSSRRIAEECSGFKTLVEKGTGRLLGVHLLGTGAEEMINVFALAIRAGLKADYVRDTLFAHPSHASNVRYML